MKAPTFIMGPYLKCLLLSKRRKCGLPTIFIIWAVPMRPLSLHMLLQKRGPMTRSLSVPLVIIYEQLNAIKKPFPNTMKPFAALEF